MFTASPSARYSSPARYSLAIWVLLAFSMAMTIAPLAWLSITFGDVRTPLIAIMATTLVLICAVYAMLMPWRFEVHDDVFVVCCCYPFHWRFSLDNVERVEVFESAFDATPSDSCEPRIKFATSMDDLVLVRRRAGCWNVTMTPESPHDWSRALAAALADRRAGPPYYAEDAALLSSPPPPPEYAEKQAYTAESKV